jgi:hypothetical protein
MSSLLWNRTRRIARRVSGLVSAFCLVVFECCFFRIPQRPTTQNPPFVIINLLSLTLVLSSHCIILPSRAPIMYIPPPADASADASAAIDSKKRTDPRQDQQEQQQQD